MEPVIRKPNEKEKQKAISWPIWEKDVSEFSWEYEKQEKCLILEGDVIVTNEEGKEFYFKKGDFVIFPKGMICKWKINKEVKKHYKTG
jgi:hypothetical protein